MDDKHTPCCTSQAHAHDDAHAHSHADANDHGHDRRAARLARISAALMLALLAEAAHWFSPQYPALHYAGMALAVLAIGLSGLGVYKAGLQSLWRLQLGIHALMAVAVTGAFLIGQWPEAAMVMALYAAAERIEDQAMDRARQAIRALLQLAPTQRRWCSPMAAASPCPRPKYRLAPRYAWLRVHAFRWMAASPLATAA